MNKFYSLLVSFFLVAVFPSMAQKTQEFESAFLNGKTHIKKERFAQAQKTLELSTIEHPSNRYNAYGTYLFAYAAHQNKDNLTARKSLLHLTQKYPDWNKIDEVHYLLATIDFETGKANQALNFLAKINNSNFDKDIQNLKEHFLPSINLEALQVLNQKYVEDTTVVKILLAKALAVPEENQNKELIQKIETQYGFSAPQKEAKSIFKETYNVAVMLPFLTEEINLSSGKQSNQHILDIYNGMRIAQQELDSQNVHINLLAFDTEKSPLKLRSILNEPSTKSIDLIFGPLYPNLSLETLEFATKNNINAVSPLVHPDFLADKVEGFEEKSNFHLFQSSYRTQAISAANFIADSLTELNAYIIYGMKEKDSIMAHQYKDAIEARGGKVVVFKQVPNRKSYQAIQKILKPIAPKPTKVEFEDRHKTIVKVRKERDFHIFACTSEAAIGAAILGTLEIGQVDVPLIVTDDWFRFRTVTLEQFENRSIYVIYPDYVNRHNPFTTDFTKKIVSKTNFIPTNDYAFLGYESLHFFAQMLTKYGTRFDLNEEFNGFKEGRLMFGKRFDAQFKDNQYVPILKMEKGTLQVVNLEVKDETSLNEE
jgi:hypothetical protein